MGKLVSSMLVTLDSFVAGPNGELDMFKVDQEFFDASESLTDQSDTVLYGRSTYELMQSYWPTAADKPDATSHDINHAAWYKRVDKIVLSTTLKDPPPNTRIISNNISAEITQLKQETPKNIQIFGSPGAVRSLIQDNLIDEYWIFVAPVILGQGIPLFGLGSNRINLKLLSSKVFRSGIIALHYEKVSLLLHLMK